MPDFTDPDVAFEYLSPFWTRMFKDAAAIHGLSHATAQHISQLYLDWLQSIGMLSIKTASPFRRDQFLPIIVRRSRFSTGPDRLSFGSGAVFGSQPDGGTYRPGDTFVYGGLERLSGLYYIGMPAGVVSVGPFIYNRLTEPSVVMLQDSEFTVIDNIIAFREDPFENPLIPKRIVSDGAGGQDEEIVLWGSSARIDDQRLYMTYGYAFPARRRSSDAYRLILETFHRIYSDGPSPLAVDMVVAALAGLPVTKEETETVETITSFGGRTMVVTDSGSYHLPAGTVIRPEIVVGTVLEAGSPLASATRVYEGGTGSNWWTTLPVLTLGREYFALPIGGLGFPNKTVRVIPADTVDDAGFDATFELTGVPSDIDAFWEASSARGLELGRRFGTALWEAEGKTLDGVADPSQDIYINPLQFVAERMIDRSVIVVKIDLSAIADLAFLIQNLRVLSDTCPVFCGLIVLLEQSVEDSFDLEPSGNVSITSVNPSEAPLLALINGDETQFTGATASRFTDTDDSGNLLTRVPEALSTATSPDIIDETADFGDADYYATGVPIAEEILTTSRQPVCTQ